MLWAVQMTALTSADLELARALGYTVKLLGRAIRTEDGWKILHFHLLTYFTTSYHSGWVKQQECFREAPFWSTKPDKKARFYVYHPDQVYVQGGQYNWGPYLPDDESF